MTPAPDEIARIVEEVLDAERRGTWKDGDDDLAIPYPDRWAVKPKRRR